MDKRIGITSKNNKVSPKGETSVGPDGDSQAAVGPIDGSSIIAIICAELDVDEEL